MSERAPEPTRNASSGHARVVGARSETCRGARAGVAYYRALTWARQAERTGSLADRTPVVRGRSCRWARLSVETWIARARSARLSLERHRRRLREDATYAICHVFGPYCEQALGVARCESGSSMTPRAQNGQYLGTFQMGAYERATYGHGANVYEQARAAYRYFVASGRDWSPWSCRWAASS